MVIDLPDDELGALCVGAVRNEDLGRFWQARKLASSTVGGDLTATRRSIGQPVRSVVKSTVDGLGGSDADPLVQFEAAYDRARPAQQAGFARSDGLTLPSWFSEDPHYPSRLGCSHNLFAIRLEAGSEQSSRVRPTRGQTLLDNLRHQTSALRAARAAAGHAVIVD